MGTSAKRNAKVEFTTSTAGLDRGLNDARRKLRSMERDQQRAAERAGKAQHEKLMGGVERRNSLLGSAFGGMAAGLGIDLASTVTDAMRDTLDFEKALVRFQIISGKTPASMAQMRDAIGKVSEETAKSRAEILEGAQTYVDLTGDVAGAEKSMRVFARVAQASDSKISDVATAAAAMQDAMHVDPSQMEAVFSGLITQGKVGAVNLKDFAGELSGLLPRFARFGVTGREGMVQLGAMFQIGRKGFGDASQAATGMEGLMGGLTLHADKFAKAGVQIYKVGKDGTKTLRPLNEIVRDIGNSKLAKDPTLLQKAFGRKEGLQFYNMLQDHLALYDQLARAGEDAGAVQRDLVTFMTSSPGRMEVAWNKVKLAIAEAMTPERIEAFTHAIEQAAKGIGTMVDVASRLSKWAESVGGGKILTGNFFDNATGAGEYIAKRGFGAMTDEDRVKEAMANRRDERGAFLEQLHPGEDQEGIEKRLIAEDQIRENLWKQSKGQGDTYSLQELQALIPQIARSSDPTMMARALGDAIAKATINVYLDGSKVSKGTQNSMHARQQAGQGR